jgi:N-methylhydantoinase A
MRLSAFDADHIQHLLAELEAESTRFVRGCDPDSAIEHEFKVYMRYTGQGWEIPVILTAEQARNPDAKTYSDLFENDYTALFGRPVDGMDIEITVWSVNATTPTAAVSPLQGVDVGDVAAAVGKRLVFDAALGQQQEAAVVLREAIKPGESVEGPAVITEDETTIILPSSRRAQLQADGCIDVTR